MKSTILNVPKGAWPKASLLAVILLTFILSVALMPLRNDANEVAAYHSEAELALLKAHASLGPLDSAQLFPTVGQCSGCHGFDNDGIAMVDADGNDVNMTDDWQPTMMANSAKDPFWRAKVSHELIANPDHSLEIQTECTACHAPQGHHTALLRGLDHYTMDMLDADTVALDGISCGTCHQISDRKLGLTHTGRIEFDTTRVAYGPYPIPFAAPMADFVGIRPVYSEHINDAGICAPCHTLINHPLDREGQPTGTSYSEQATYHEWLNSVYNTDNVSCQACHMPRIDDTVIISDNYIFLSGRSPYGLHGNVGGNVTMLELMKANRDVLDINATGAQFDSIISATYRMLQKQTLDMELSLEQLTPDTAFFNLNLLNKAGHKFPSGYPSRRAFVTFVVTTEAGDTLFQSGVLNDQFEVAGHDDHYEPHYDVINQEDQVQIYEIVNGDVNGQFTSVLEFAYVALKDNRLPPLGFTTTHEVYDTTLIAGKALFDVDFNKVNGVEGSGSDIVHYHIPLNGYTGLVDVSAQVFYQPLPPKWLAEMFAETSDPIETFRDMYNQADKEPVEVALVRIEDLFVESVGIGPEPAILYDLRLFPNPSSQQAVEVNIPSGVELEKAIIYSASGKRVDHLALSNNRLLLPQQAGLYFIHLYTNKGIAIRKLVQY
ncbi:MAG: T9SS type A sorting domain-containing protein [Bacteroidota bacterium]